MPGLFQKDGICFQYPANWKLEREDADSGWTVSVQSPDTGFLILTFDRNMPETAQVAQTVLDALQADYPGLEAEDALETLAGQPAFGHDIRFFSLDLTNTCCTRSFYTDTGTLLMMWQVNDLELEQFEPIVRAIQKSLRVDE
jgi:hypothetical protein